MALFGIQSVYRPIRTQTVSISGTSAATSNAVGSGIRIVRLVSTTDCHYTVAQSPTATTSDPFLPANTVEYISIHEGEKVAFIQNSASGTGYVTEMSQ